MARLRTAWPVVIDVHSRSQVRTRVATTSIGSRSGVGMDAPPSSTLSVRPSVADSRAGSVMRKRAVAGSR